MMRFTALVLILAVCCGFRSDAPPPKRIAWYRGSFEGALELARKRNLPVMFVFLTEGEVSSDMMADDVFRDAALIKDARQVVPVICCNGSHGHHRERQGKRRVSVCKKYGSVTCEQHQSYHRRAYELLFAGGVMRTPTVRLCHPGQPDDDELKTLAETVDNPGAAPTRLAIRAAVKKMGPGVDAATYDAVQEALTRARNERKRKRLTKAWGVIAKAPKVAPGSFLGLAIARETEEISDAVRVELKKAAARGLVDYAVALAAAERDYKGAPLAAEAKASLKKLGKSPAGKKALKEARRDAKFQKELVRALAHEDKKRWERAIRAYLRVADRAGTLPAGVRARARLAEMEADPGLKLRVDKVRAAEVAKRKK